MSYDIKRFLGILLGIVLIGSMVQVTFLFAIILCHTPHNMIWHDLQYYNFVALNAFIIGSLFFGAFKVLEHFRDFY